MGGVPDLRYLPFPLGVLVAMWPWSELQVLLRREDVNAIEGSDEFLGLPQLLKDVHNSWFGAGFPSVLLMG